MGIETVQDIVERIAKDTVAADSPMAFLRTQALFDGAAHVAHLTASPDGFIIAAILKVLARVIWKMAEPADRLAIVKSVQAALEAEVAKVGLGYGFDG